MQNCPQSYSRDLQLDLILLAVRGLQVLRFAISQDRGERRRREKRETSNVP